MVKFNPVLATALAAGSFISTTLAHPGEHHDDHHVAMELAKRDAHAGEIARGLEACASHPSFLAMKARGVDRRATKAKHLRQKRGISSSKPYKTKRSIAERDLAALETFETYKHNFTSSGYTASTDYATLFDNYSNVSCALTPEVVVGPYYVIGEYVRSDVTEGQDGVPVHLEYQYIDVSTCEPATGLYLEAWQANATGVYSGIVASGNGDDTDADNIDTTFLRGIQPVDSDGVAAFDTIFAGHYAGRATHIHLIAQQNGTEYENGTYAGGFFSHVGQLFFPTDLKAQVELTYPYNTNTQAVTTNDEDMWAPDQADNDYNPFPDYAYLGDDITDGLLMWINIGINMSASYTVSAAAQLYADGGETLSGGTLGGGSGGSSSGNSSSGGGGSMTGGGGNGTMTMPSGSGGPGGVASSSGVVSVSTTSVVASTTSSAAASSISSSTSSSATSSIAPSVVSVSSSTSKASTSTSSAASVVSASIKSTSTSSSKALTTSKSSSSSHHSTSTSTSSAAHSSSTSTSSVAHSSSTSSAHPHSSSTSSAHHSSSSSTHKSSTTAHPFGHTTTAHHGAKTTQHWTTIKHGNGGQNGGQNGHSHGGNGGNHWGH